MSLPRDVADLVDLLDTLVACSEFLDNYVDVIDGNHGDPIPNRAMSLKQDVDALIEREERTCSRAS